MQPRMLSLVNGVEKTTPSHAWLFHTSNPSHVSRNLNGDSLAIVEP
jgi:hypothetical protein